MEYRMSAPLIGDGVCISVIAENGNLYAMPIPAKGTTEQLKKAIASITALEEGKPFVFNDPISGELKTQDHRR